MSELAKLFAEFVEAQEEGKNPSADDFVARAGKGGSCLRVMLDSFVVADTSRKAAAKRILEHTMLTASEYGRVPGGSAASLGALVAQAEERVRRRDRCPRGKIAEDIASAAGVNPALRAKFKDYYHQLKTGQLDPRPTTSRLLNAISSVLGIAVSELLTAAANYREPSGSAVLQFARATGEKAQPAMTLNMAAGPSEWDFVDRMFLGDGSNA